MKKLDLKSITFLNKFLSQEDISFIIDSLETLEIKRNEDDTFNRSIYVIERRNKKFKYLFEKCDEVVFENYDKKLTSNQIYIIKYFEGDYIKRHNDNWQTEVSQGRLLSLVSQMTHPNLYEGGDTLVYNGDDTIKLSKEQGSTIIFPSSMDHELTKVTKGERFSFVVMFKESLGKVVI